MSFIISNYLTSWNEVPVRNYITRGGHCHVIHPYFLAPSFYGSWTCILYNTHQSEVLWQREVLSWSLGVLSTCGSAFSGDLYHLATMHSTEHLIGLFWGEIKYFYYRIVPKRLNNAHYASLGFKAWGADFVMLCVCPLCCAENSNHCPCCPGLTLSQQWLSSLDCWHITCGWLCSMNTCKRLCCLEMPQHILM